MIEPVILRSLPHTGTLWLQALLNRMIGLDSHLHVSKDFDGWRPVSGQRMVIPLRDPCLSYISHLNRANERAQLELHSRIAEYTNVADVHFFRIDGPQRYRTRRLVQLGAFLGADWPETDWAPVNQSADTTGVRTRYTRGEPTVEVQPVIDYVNGHPHVSELYTRHGYTMDWLEGATV